MSRQSVTALIGLAVFPLLAIGVATYLLANGTLPVEIVAGAILILGIGIFSVAAALLYRVSQQEDRLRRQYDRLRDLGRKVDAAMTKLDDVAVQAKLPVGRLDQIMADVRAMGENLRQLIQKNEAPVSRPAEGVAAPSSQSAAAQGLPRIGGEHLELLLEPVIELASGVTAHYRALLDLTDDQGHVVRHTELMQKADQGGMRPALDAHMVKLVAPVLRRLRARNPSMRAIVPIGISTLGSRDDTTRVVANLERDVDVAGGIVFEFDHRGLGQLSNIGIENLARLGRLGATLALSNVQVAGLDLASLRQLGVRFLSFPPHAADAGFGPAPSWREFVQYARAMQFHVIVSGIETPQQASAANQVGRYGYGPFFAPPRKVRADAGVRGVDRNASAA